MAKKKGTKLMDLLGKKAVRNQLESYLQARKPSLVVFNGHGNQEVISGQNNEPLVIAAF